MEAALMEREDPHGPRTGNNARVQGWINYYGRFYQLLVIRFLRRIDEYSGALGHAEVQATAQTPRKDEEVPGGSVQTRQPNLFAHWRPTAQANNRMMGAV